MATIPSQPGIFRVLSYTNVRVDGDVNGGSGPGGAPIDSHQIAWGISPNVPGSGGGFGNLNVSTGSGFISGLTPGSTYYFWNRWHNAYGWGPWSPRSQITMRDAPDPTDYPAFVRRTQTSITIRINPNYNGGAPINNYRIYWGTSPNVPGSGGSSFTTVSQENTINNLQPGVTYYFWAQAHNIYGYSVLSPRSFIVTIAGAWIKVGLVWHRAVPYVKVAGVWRVARPWGRIAGFWNETPE